MTFSGKIGYELGAFMSTSDNASLWASSTLNMDLFSFSSKAISNFGGGAIIFTGEELSVRITSA